MIDTLFTPYPQIVVYKEVSSIENVTGNQVQYIDFLSISQLYLNSDDLMRVALWRWSFLIRCQFFSK